MIIINDDNTSANQFSMVNVAGICSQFNIQLFALEHAYFSFELSMSFHHSRLWPCFDFRH